MASLEDFATATAMRDVMQQLVRDELAATRPEYRYGYVVAINRTLRVASVLFPEDTNPVNVAMGALQPGEVGQLVRVEGLRGDRFITDVMAPARLDQFVTPTGATSAWTSISLLNSWTNFGSPYFDAQYCIDAEGWVHLRGLVKSGTALANLGSVPICAGGMWASTQIVFGGVGRCMISGSSVLLDPGMGTNAYVSLDGIQYPTFTSDQIGSNFTPMVGYGPNPNSGQENYPPGAFTRANGMVVTSGQVGGAASANERYPLPVPGLGYGSHIYSGLAYNGTYAAARVDLLSASLVNGNATWLTGASAFTVVGNYEFGLMRIATNWTPVTFQNSWVNWGNNNFYPGAAYYKDSFGFVHLRGVVKNGSSANATVFTLPAGFRPSATSVHATYSNSGACRMDVGPSGTVSAPAGGGTTYMSLDGINFRAEL